MPKQLDTLVEDIYSLFDPKIKHEVNDDYIEEFGENIKHLLRERLKGQQERSGSLRFSALGQPDRKIWLRAKGYEGEELPAKTYFKFLYGDILEQLILFLAKEAGHTVELEQHEVEVDGVLGHIDGIIDGVVVDVKSASPFSYKKFKEESIINDDPFGYIQQLSGYNNVLNPDVDAAFIAFDKVNGSICVSPVSSQITKKFPPEDRIKHLKSVLASDQIPPRCYDDIPDGKSGNMKLSVGCSYCELKKHCWPGLRTFLYSTGPRFLTKVAREPDVFEVEGNYDDA